MKKINFVNNDAPYLSAENLNQMQDNIENAIDEKNDKLESGTIFSSQMNTYNEGSTTKKYYNLSFKKTYIIPPTVLVSFHNNNPENYGDIAVYAGNVTNTGCRLNFGYNISNNVLGISYVVIPKD